MREGVGDLSTVKMLTSADMARIFGMTQNAIWHAEKAGRLPKAIRIGKSTRWLAQDVSDFIDRQRGAC